MQLYGLAPWVGAGTMTNQYAFNVLFLSWHWRAKLISLNMTCWDSTTGQLSDDAERMSEMAQLIANARLVLNTGSCALVCTEAPDWCADLLVDGGGDLPVKRGSLDEFALYVREQEAALTTRLMAEFPNYDWVTPTIGAVETIDKARTGSDESLRLWEYYRDIINPNLMTPEGPPELYNSVGRGSSVDLARVDSILATPDDVSNRVWRCELAYRLIVYSDARMALDEAGL